MLKVLKNSNARHTTATVLALAAMLSGTAAWANPPGQSGHVYRFIVADAAGEAFYEPSYDLTFVLGIDIVALCSGASPESAIADVSVQAVLMSDEPGEVLDRVAVLEKAEGYAGLWQGNVMDGEICANVLGTPPVAEGTIRYRYRDNDIYWLGGCDLDAVTNTNAWGSSWNGVLEGYFGQPVTVSGQFRAVWQQCDPSSYKERLHINVVGN